MLIRQALAKLLSAGNVPCVLLVKIIAPNGFTLISSEARDNLPARADKCYPPREALSFHSFSQVHVTLQLVSRLPLNKRGRSTPTPLLA